MHHAAVIERIVAESGWSGSYLFAILISAGIAILGLLLPSSAVIIGAMLISPLMLPIIGLGFGIATFDLNEIRRSVWALLLGALFAVGLSTIIVAASPIQTVTSEIAVRTRPNLFDLLVALLSALAGSYAIINERSTTVVGVAIATALMPPLAVVGFGLATQNWTVLGGSLLLFLTNLITIALTAATVARLYGFGAHLSPGQTRLQGTLIVAGLAALAVPLGFALKQIAVESFARRQIREAVLQPFSSNARISQLDIDFAREPAVVRAIVLTPMIVPGADAQVIAATREAVRIPLDLHVDQIRVGLESGAGEAAQIAAAQSSDGRAPVARDARNVVAERIALIAGVPEEEVLVDTVARRAAVRLAPLPGADFATYRAVEQRATLANGNWTVDLTPPDGALPIIPIADETPDADALGVAAWAARRLDRGITVSGPATARDAAITQLTTDGVRVTAGPSRRGDTLTLDWTSAQPAR
ncbi:DUF389 domain-containing protein [Sphingomonas mucosissima]|uniref:DUF389 domain-containing protein n=1 Tax=Sphingomonas mucosissima TaxID=370959 RepID=A0A245ZFW9_9SPHN|nr:DUF389 domain-containing protein [Sphingomonas mucosissima]OWK28635.1 hypothetical protein SPMU_28980 [Sphingomonas mucosissima]